MFSKQDLLEKLKNDETYISAISSVDDKKVRNEITTMTTKFLSSILDVIEAADLLTEKKA